MQIQTKFFQDILYRDNFFFEIIEKRDTFSSYYIGIFLITETTIYCILMFVKRFI